MTDDFGAASKGGGRMSDDGLSDLRLPITARNLRL